MTRGELTRRVPLCASTSVDQVHPQVLGERGGTRRQIKRLASDGVAGTSATWGGASHRTPHTSDGRLATGPCVLGVGQRALGWVGPCLKEHPHHLHLRGRG